MLHIGWTDTFVSNYTRVIKERMFEYLQFKIRRRMVKIERCNDSAADVLYEAQTSLLAVCLPLRDRYNHQPSL